MDEVTKFQKKITKKYHKYAIRKKKRSFKQICFPVKYTHQNPQLFVSKYINPLTKFKSLLIYHKIGAGKTCAAIKIAEEWKDKRDIYIVCPASLIGNFYKEIRSECTGETYMINNERSKLSKMDIHSREYKDTIKAVNAKIDKYYNILSYNKFVDKIKKHKISLENAVLIMDEVQNIVSEHGSYYKIILNAIKKAPISLRVVIMSATPIFDKPNELGLTLNYLRPREEFLVGQQFNERYISYKLLNGVPKYTIKNTQELRLKMNTLISYYQGAPSYVFPERIDKIVRCPMSKYQYDSYKVVQEREGKINKLDLLNLPINFFIGSRIISNIAFPNNQINMAGLGSLTKRTMDIDHLQNYSTKFYYLIKKIINAKGTVFVYSNFRHYGGILTFTKILEHYGYQNAAITGIGRHRYAVWSGEESFEDREKIKEIFNSKNNIKGTKIKLILGSPAIKEGVTLLRVSQVHILEPYWNMSRIEQVIGRAVRYCSHRDIEPEKRKVKIYIYIATVPKEIQLKEQYLPKIKKSITVDEHIYNIALNKKRLSVQFEEIMKNAAIDYYLFQ